MFCPHMLPESVMSQAVIQTVSSLNKVPLDVTAIAEKLTVVEMKSTPPLSARIMLSGALAAILPRHVLIEDAPGE